MATKTSEATVEETAAVGIAVGLMIGRGDGPGAMRALMGSRDPVSRRAVLLAASALLECADIGGEHVRSFQ